VERIVKLCKTISPPIEFRSLAEREVKLIAPITVKSPLICCMPSRLREPATVDAIARAPLTVEHDAASVLASFWELIVAVGWEQREV
jgi:hypothetical protein